MRSSNFGKVGDRVTSFSNLHKPRQFLLLHLKLVLCKVTVVWVKYICCFFNKEEGGEMKKKMKREKDKQKKRIAKKVGNRANHFPDKS